jgi:hypothetical protein
MFPETYAMQTRAIESNNDAIFQALDKYEPAGLIDFKKEKLRESFDTKFIFHVSSLAGILIEAAPYYNLLNPENHRIISFESQYYDTPDFQFYLDQHNEKLRRYKIRRRICKNLAQAIFEVKLFYNTGKVIKKRFETNNQHRELSKDERKFIKKHTLFKPKDLPASLTTAYDRITLIGKDGCQKITFDLNIQNRFRGRVNQAPFLVIAEIKQSVCSEKPMIQKIFKEHKIVSCNFSKYCFGLAILHPQIKSNNFKTLFNQINKINNGYDITSTT